jgi:hypothetical protein
MDSMEIADHGDDFTLDLSELHEKSIQDNFEADPYYVRPNRTRSDITPPTKELVDYTLIPEEGAFVTARCPTTGKNIYFSKKSTGERRNKKDALFKEITKSRTRGLLMKPVWQLMRDIEKENETELKRLQK